MSKTKHGFDPRICPVAFMGQLNGIYEYYALHCAAGTAHLLRSATPLNTIGCPGDDYNCVPGDRDGHCIYQGCADERGMPGYLSPDARFPDQPGSVDVLDWQDRTFLDQQGRKRFCRLFLLRLTMGTERHYAGLGYELQPGSVTPEPPMIEPDGMCGCTCEIECDGVPFFVISYGTLGDEAENGRNREPEPADVGQPDPNQGT